MVETGATSVDESALRRRIDELEARLELDRKPVEQARDRRG